VNVEKTQLAQQREVRAGSRGGPEWLSGPWPGIIQLVWLALAVFVLYVVVSEARIIVRQAQQICTSAACSGYELTRGELHLLHGLGFSADAWGIYVAAIQVGFFAVYFAVATLIIWRKTWDRLAVFVAFLLLVFGGITVGGPGSGSPISPSAAQVVASVLALAGSFGMVVFFYLFPSGRFVVRWPLLLTIPWAAFQAGQYLAPGSELDLNRLPWLIALASWIPALGSVIYVQVYRYRTVSNLSERQQTKWIVYGVTAGLVGFVSTLAVFSIPAVLASPLFLLLGPIGFFGFLALIPLSIGFAMLRYRLWDVDVLINRTLVYGLLTACLAILYVGGVVLLQALFRTVTGQGSGLAVAISTLAIAALFQPLRRGFQAFIDRRFYRRKYDATRTLASFSARLRDDVDLEGVTAEILTVVQETLQPAHASLWLRQAEGDQQ
jgi:hypothetical protein